MTIVCAIKDPAAGGVWFASDTLAVNCDIKENCGPKFVRCGKWGIGVAGAVRGLNLLQGNKDQIAALPRVSDVVDAIETMLVNDKWERRKVDGRPGNYQAEWLITDGTELWAVSHELSVLSCEYGAIGTGTAAALGARHIAVHRYGALDRDILVRDMVAAAIAVDHNCGGEVWYDLIKPLETTNA